MSSEWADTNSHTSSSPNNPKQNPIRTPNRTPIRQPTLTTNITKQKIIHTTNQKHIKVTNPTVAIIVSVRIAVSVCVWVFNAVCAFRGPVNWYRCVLDVADLYRQASMIINVWLCYLSYFVLYFLRRLQINQHNINNFYVLFIFQFKFEDWLKQNILCCYTYFKSHLTNNNTSIIHMR